LEKQTQKTMIHVDDYLEKCQALIPKGDDFINRPSTNRTFGVGEREEFRLFERRKAEGLVTRFAEILLGTIVRMSVFAEVGRAQFRNLISDYCPV